MWIFSASYRTAYLRPSMIYIPGNNVIRVTPGESATVRLRPSGVYMTIEEQQSDVATSSRPSMNISVAADTSDIPDLGPLKVYVLLLTA